MKKSLSVILAFALLLSLPCISYAYESGEGIDAITTAEDLQQAIIDASDAQEIAISGSIEISEDMQFGCEEKSVLIVSANGESRIIINANVEFENISFCGAWGGSESIVIQQIGGEADFSNSSFLYTHGSETKSSYYLDAGAATFTNCLFEGGFAENGGFVFAAEDTTLDMTDTVLSAGVATGNGGAIYTMGTVSLTGCRISNGAADGLGGAIWHNGNITLTDCDISGNYSPDEIQVYPEIIDDEEPEPVVDEPEPYIPWVPSRPHRTVVHESVVVKAEEPSLKCGKVYIDAAALEKLASSLPLFFPSGRTISREEMAGFVWGILADDCKKAVSGAASYSDIEESAYRGIINALTVEGVFLGSGDGHFCPANNLSWVQMIVVLTRFTEAKEASIDIPADHWAISGLSTAVANGWINEEDIRLDADATIGDLINVINAIRGAAA